ncbi:MAG TPA: inositol monophosphatase family protein [Solirubrobacteraceae bacterium]|jgi:myo-inositol-1(or 4)-monophosphatase|nr:inositol monophosphatase family protein [Solirubrobacteraceae bacterium]
MDAIQADWLALCRGASEQIIAMLAERPSTAERVRTTGARGAGGDQTLMIDEAAEAIVFAHLSALHDRGARFTALSEERGEVHYGDGPVLVVIDPIDGSLNAKRGMAPYAVSLAVADGPTMADVVFGYVRDLARGEEWAARRGGGATLDGRPLATDAAERRTRDGRLELLAVESADPRWVSAAAPALEQLAHRLRAIGSIALALCQVAGGRADAMATLWRTRAVDAAAGQLIVREAGGAVAFGAPGGPLAAPLDLSSRYALAAAREARALEDLRALSTWET